MIKRERYLTLNAVSFILSGHAQFTSKPIENTLSYVMFMCAELASSHTYIASNSK